MTYLKELTKGTVRLREAEDEMRTVVQKSDTPFLSLLGGALSTETRFDIHLAVAEDPTVEGYTRLLYRFPTLFSIHLASTLMAGMGQTGSFDIYPHIRTALQLRTDPSSDERAALWAAFRRAVLRLGLEVSPRTFGHHYMADTYLRQVGVPIAFADDLAERMLTFAKTAGLPDRDDPEGIARWQSALESRLVAPFSRVAQRAVATDSQGFYTSVFIKVHDAGGADVQANPLEQAMAKAFDKLPAGARFRRAAVPYLALNNGFLGVFVPAAESARAVQLDIDDDVVSFRIGSEDEFLSIDAPLPLRLSVKDGATQQTYEVWGDEKPNRMLLFTDNGRFKGRAQLGISEPVVLPPGCYTVLSRFLPPEADAEAVSVDPRLYTFSILLHPGQKQVFSNGPAELTLQGEGRPLALWDGPTRGTKDSVEFNYGELRLKLWIPRDWLEFSSGRFEIVFSSNATEKPAVAAVTTDAEGYVAVSVSEGAMKDVLRPGLWRVLAEIRRPGETRSLLRTSVLFWNGLDSASGGLKFRLKRFPANLVALLCENFLISEGLIEPKKTVTRHLSLSFQLDERRVQTLSWNAPGVFVEIEGTSATGTRFRLSRPLGTTEVVSQTSSKQIIVSSSEAGELSLGEWIQMNDFSKQNSKHLPASFLASRITPQSSTLGFRAIGTSVVVPLLKLVQPHFVDSVSDKIADGQLVIKLESPNELEAIRLRAHDILSGQDIEVELDANASDWTSNRLGRARLMCLHGAKGGFVACVYISLELWSAGAWTINFDGRIAGIWGHLQNERTDLFAIGLLCDASGAPSTQATLTSAFSELTDKESLAVFMRVQKELLPCYAESSWVSIRWLAAAWRSLAGRWRGHEAASITALVDMACSRPPEESAPSWMPQQHIGAELTAMFALSADEYRKVNENRHPLARALRTIAEFKHLYPTVFGDLLHPCAAMGFSNFPAVARGSNPHAFTLAGYADALQQVDGGQADLIRLEEAGYVPGAGDYLGPLHYKYAMSCLDAAYENSLGGNEIRRGQAIGLCRHIRKEMPGVHESFLARLKGTRPHVDPWSCPEESMTSEQAQKQETLANMLHFLSLLALSCRASARSPEPLQVFTATLKSADIPVEGCVSYLLQIGEAFFAYYLLLWELVLTSEQD